MTTADVLSVVDPDAGGGSSGVCHELLEPMTIRVQSSPTNLLRGGSGVITPT